MRLSYPCTQEELVWWIENVDKSFNVISHGKPVIEIRTDASKKGWRVYLNGDTTQGLWSGTESQLRINEIELKAILFALLAFGERPTTTTTLYSHFHYRVCQTYASVNSSCAQHPPGLLRGICPPRQSRGWGICKFCAARGLGIRQTPGPFLSF